MKTGQITAKLRDAVPVCLMVEDNEIKRYKNIELPDAIKEIELSDFHFHIAQDGKITFQIHYAPGVLPEVFPASRPKVTRAEKAAAKAKANAEQEANKPTAGDSAPAAEDNAPEAIPEAAITEEPAAMVESPATEEATPVEAAPQEADTSKEASTMAEAPQEIQPEATAPEATAEDTTKAAPAPAKRRGRPRKNPIVTGTKAIA